MATMGACFPTLPQETRKDGARTLCAGAHSDHSTGILRKSRRGSLPQNHAKSMKTKKSKDIGAEIG